MTAALGAAMKAVLILRSGGTESEYSSDLVRDSKLK